MPRGGALRVVTSESDGEAHARVTDEGVGIPRRIRERIFEPFFSTKGASGTGMGLAVSYGIVTRHSGRIEVESEPGRGATFSLSFPVTRVTTDSTPAGVMRKTVTPLRAAPTLPKLGVLALMEFIVNVCASAGENATNSSNMPLHKT